MLVTVATFALVASVIGFTFFLGYAQGRHVEKRRVKKRTLKTEWMLKEALWRWAPWSDDPSNFKARLAAEYEELKK
jgi:membrane protein YqaA with SNARE-associated domain